MKPLLEQYRELSTWAKSQQGETLPESPSALARIAQARMPARAGEWTQLANQNTIQNAALMTSAQAESAGRALALGLREKIGGTYAGDVASEFAGNLVTQAPSLLGTFGASRVPGLASIPAMAGLFGYQALDTYNRTADPTAATAEAGSNVGAMILANEAGRAITSRYGLSGLSEFATHAATQTIGNLAADLVGFATRPTVEKDGTVDLKQPTFGPGGRLERNTEFLKDPVQAGAYALGQGAFGAIAGYGEMGLQKQLGSVQEKKAQGKNIFEDIKVGEELFPLDAAPQGGVNYGKLKSFDSNLASIETKSLKPFSMLGSKIAALKAPEVETALLDGIQGVSSVKDLFAGSTVLSRAVRQLGYTGLLQENVFNTQGRNYLGDALRELKLNPVGFSERAGKIADKIVNADYTEWKGIIQEEAKADPTASAFVAQRIQAHGRPVVNFDKFSPGQKTLSLSRIAKTKEEALALSKNLGEITSEDGWTELAKTKVGDFAIVDPPYVGENRYGHGLGHISLSQRLLDLDLVVNKGKQGVKILYFDAYEKPLVAKLQQAGFTIKVLPEKVPGAVKEFMATNYQKPTGYKLLSLNSVPDDLAHIVVGDALARSARTIADDSFGLRPDFVEQGGFKTQVLPGSVPRNLGDLYLARKEKFTPDDALMEQGRFVIRTPFTEERAHAFKDYGYNAIKISGDEMLVTNFSTQALPSFTSKAKIYGGAQQAELESSIINKTGLRLNEDRLGSLKAIVNDLAPDEANAYLRFIRDTGADLNQPTLLGKLPSGFRGLYEPKTNLVSISRKLDIQGALETLVHETSHATLMRIRALKPETYLKVEQFVNALTPESRAWLLSELHTAAGKNNYETYVSYGADPVSFLSKRGEVVTTGKEKLITTAEFTGRTLELLFSLASQGKKGKIREYLEQSPVPFTSTLFDLHSAVRKLFRREDPSLAKYLPKESSEALYKTISVLGKELFNAESANRTFIKRWNELTLTEQGRPLQAEDGTFEYERDYPTVLKDADEVTHFFSKDETKVQKQEAMNSLVRYFANMQFITSRYRFTQELFDVHNRFQPARIEVPRIAIAEGAGTFKDGVFTPLQGTVDAKLAHFDRTIKELAASKRQVQLLGGVWKNQAELRGKRLLKHLYTAAELKAAGLTDNSISVFFGMQRAIEATQKIRIVQIRQEGSNAIGTFLWTAKQHVTKNGVIEIKNTWTKNQEGIQKTIGATRELLTNTLKREPRELELAQAIYDSAAFRPVKELMLKNGMFGEKLTDVDASFFMRALEVDGLFHKKVQTWFSYLTDVGYMPMVREARYRVSAENAEGKKYYRDFDSVSEAQKDAARLQKDGYEVGVFDTDKPDQFTASFRSKDMFNLATNAVNSLERMKGSLSLIQDEDVKSKLIANFESVKKSFKPLADEVRESISTRPERYLQKRDLVEGFREEMFLPSAFTFIESSLQDGQRSVSKSASEFLLADPVYFDPSTPADLRGLMQKSSNYVFSNTASEASRVRKFIYFQSLVGSMKNAIQNLAQPAFTLTNLLVQESNGNVGYALSVHARAMKEVLAYNSRGKASSDFMSNLMKTAEDTGVWNPRSLDVFLEGDATTYFKPGVSFNARYAKFFANQLFEKVSWVAKETERFNRQVGFVAGAILAKERGKRTQSHEIFAIGRTLTDQANFVGSKANRPHIFHDAGWFHGPLVLASTLRMFSFNALNQLLAIAVPVFNKKSVSLVTGEKYKSRAGSMIALGYAMGALAVAAGLRGLPFAEDANNAIEELTGKDLLLEGEKLTREHFFNVLGEKEATSFAEQLFRGGPTKYGISASSTFGMGSLLGLQKEFASQRGATTTSVLAALGGGAAANLVDKYSSTVGEVHGAFLTLPEDAPLDEKAAALVSAGKLAAPTLVKQFTDFRDVVFAGKAVSAKTGKTFYERDAAQNPEDALTSTEFTGALMGMPLHKVKQKQEFDAYVKATENEIRVSKDRIYDAMVNSLVRAKEKGLPVEKQSLEWWKEELKRLGVVEERQILDAVLSRYMESTSQGRPLPTSPAGLAVLKDALDLYPGVSLPVQHPLTPVALRLHFAKQLGLLQTQAELVDQMLPALQQAGLDAALIQKGLNPQAARSVLLGETPSQGVPTRLPGRVVVEPPIRP